MEAGGLSQDAPVYATTLILVRHTGVLTTLTVVLAVRLDTWLMITGIFVPVLVPCTYVHRDSQVHTHAQQLLCSDKFVLGVGDVTSAAEDILTSLEGLLVPCV